MDKESELRRRKFMEVGIFAITGTIAAVSTTALARFAVGPSFEKSKQNGSRLIPRIFKMKLMALQE